MARKAWWPGKKGKLGGQYGHKCLVASMARKSRGQDGRKAVSMTRKASDQDSREGLVVSQEVLLVKMARMSGGQDG